MELISKINIFWILTKISDIHHSLMQNLHTRAKNVFIKIDNLHE
jgi:hypothetical protein